MLLLLSLLIIFLTIIFITIITIIIIITIILLCCLADGAKLDAAVLPEGEAIEEATGSETPQEGGESSSQPDAPATQDAQITQDDAIVNEIAKQQVLVQYLKVDNLRILTFPFLFKPKKSCLFSVTLP